jgi:hypothetical protein
LQEQKPNLHTLADRSRVLLPSLLGRLIKELPEDVRSEDWRLYDDQLLEDDNVLDQLVLGVRTAKQLKELVSGGDITKLESNKFYRYKSLIFLIILLVLLLQIMRG